MKRGGTDPNKHHGGRLVLVSVVCLGLVHVGRLRLCIPCWLKLHPAHVALLAETFLLSLDKMPGGIYQSGPPR